MRVFFRISQWLIVALLADFAHAQQCPPAPQTPTPEIIQQLKTTAKNRGFLWEISKGGHTSWLYGTLHVGKLDWAFPGPIIVNALLKSDTVAMELDLSDPVTMQKLGDLSRQDAGKIPEIFKPRFKKLLASVCLPDTMMDSVNPVILMSSIELFAARSGGLEAAYGVEPVLTGFAHSAKKSVVALETAESQMAALLGPANSQSDEEIEDALQLIESGKTDTIIQHLASSWADGNIRDLENYSNWCECMETDIARAEMKRINDDRNGPMADAIAALHERGKSVFVAVGSLHMIGEQGIPALLKRKGYEVKPIAFK